MITLYEFDNSPYCAKVRKLLDYKKLPYERVEVDYLARREPKALSGQGKVPVIQDGERVVNDSTAIALYLEERYPEPSILPADPCERVRALLIEEWADEQLAMSAAPAKMLAPGNAEAIVRASLARRSVPAVVKLLAPLAPALIRARMKGRRAKGRTFEEIRRDFQRELDRLEPLLAAAPYLMGPSPTLPDFAVFGFLATMEGLSGFEDVRARPAISRWYDRVKAL